MLHVAGNSHLTQLPLITNPFSWIKIDFTYELLTACIKSFKRNYENMDFLKITLDDFWSWKYVYNVTKTFH